ncbi:MAG: DNA-directed RNA polymerase subunit A' [Thermoplasmata archaeon]
MTFGIPKRISAILFALMSPTEIRQLSATKVVTADTYDDDGFPIDMGLMDSKLGVIEPGLRCKTCGRRVDECPGHFGHIDLAMPVIHVGYTKTIKNLLKSTCRVCGKLLLTKEQVEERRKKVIDSEEEELQADQADQDEAVSMTFRGAGAVQECPYCGAVQKKIALDKPTSFREGGHKLTPKEVRERLERITTEDLPMLGLSSNIRPEWMVLTALPVPPVTVRPSITLESGDRSEDDLTHKLVDILRINQRLRENRDAGAPQLIVEDLWELLQYHVTTYFDNQTSGIPPARHRSGRPLKTLTQRLKGKEGRFRSNLSGKRVNFSARTVISPDPFISINEVGIPEEVARELTVPIYITKDNVEIVKEIVRRGPSPKSPYGYLPGVTYIFRPDGRRIKISEKNCQQFADALELGSKVERQLVDGDIVLFNRQPSLHRMSMMAHEVKILPSKTFRLNLCVCPPYNADFDGDEMNLHALQSEEARAEAKILMRVQEHILSPRFGGSVTGALHDHITGAFIFTHKDQKFTKEEVSILLSNVGYKLVMPKPNVVENGKEFWTGKQLFSLALPKDLDMEFRASICQNCDMCLREKCNIDAYVKIEDGELLCGTIDDKAVGAFKGKILDKIVRDYGTDHGREFLDVVTKFVIGAITLRGFTTGIDDEDIPVEGRKQITEILKESDRRVNELVREYNKGTLEQLPGRSMEETLEVEIMRVLGRVRDNAGQIAGKYLGLENPVVIMAKSGARGSMLNLSQMTGLIGQQSVRGERISRGYKERTLPHFEKGDRGASAKGFVRSSYKSGLTPTEYFFHCVGGREGLVDTAVRTSRSGYMQRRLVNALEDLKVGEDSTIKNTGDMVVQFSFGDDNIDPSKSVRGEAVDVDDIISSVVGRKFVPTPAEEEEKLMSFGGRDFDLENVVPEGSEEETPEVEGGEEGGE